MSNHEEDKLFKYATKEDGFSFINLIEEIIGGENLKRKIAKDIRKDKIKQLMAQGVDRKMAGLS